LWTAATALDLRQTAAPSDNAAKKSSIREFSGIWRRRSPAESPAAGRGRVNEPGAPQGWNIIQQLGFGFERRSIPPPPEGDSPLLETLMEKPHETVVCAARYKFDERAFARYVFLRNPSRPCFRFFQMGT
jgi:hypothetical protein